MAFWALVEYGHSLISRPELFCNGKYLVAPLFETSVQCVFKGFLWFSSYLITFYFFSKTGCSKIGSMLVSTLFSLYLKINMDKTSQKVTKYKNPERADQDTRAGKML